MKVSRAEAFFAFLDKRVGPFDRPLKFHVFPFAAGGAVNVLTVGAGRGHFTTYVSWDLFEHPKQKRGTLGAYELLAVCDDAEWCAEMFTKIGSLSLLELLEPGETLDIGAWVAAEAPIQGIIFEKALGAETSALLRKLRGGLLRCIGITRPELEFALKQGTAVLVECLKRGGIYPRTAVRRRSVNLTAL